MPVLRNIGCLATCRSAGGQGELHLIRDAALAWRKDRIDWVGPESELPAEWRGGGGAGGDGGSARGMGNDDGGGDARGGGNGGGERQAPEPETWDAAGGLVVPGLVDCHTHLAFGGWRADEFRRRLQGASYQEIAAEGGGIAATVRHTRAASEEELTERARGVLREMASLGVTTVEAKSGYGLTLEAELKQLRVYRRLAGEGPTEVAGRAGGDVGGDAGGPGGGVSVRDRNVEGSPPLPRIVPTFLGAHTVPPERSGDREGYLAVLVDEWIPRVAREGLARFCDVFVEEGVFTVEEGRRVLEAGRAHGLTPKVHADQLTDGGGSTLAAEVGAASADHLEHVSDEGIRALAETGTVAVTLPLAALYLDEPAAPARKMVEAGVPVAVATDFNPGTAPSYHLPLALTLACVRQRMTPQEALKGATLYAARACGLEAELGSLEPGKAADFAVLDAPDPVHWLYHFRPNACRLTVIGGRVAWGGWEVGVGGEAG